MICTNLNNTTALELSRCPQIALKKRQLDNNLHPLAQVSRFSTRNESEKVQLRSKIKRTISEKKKTLGWRKEWYGMGSGGCMRELIDDHERLLLLRSSNTSDNHQTRMQLGRTE